MAKRLVLECRHDGIEIGAPNLLRNRRKDVVPDRGEAACQLRNPGGPRHEPPVQVLPTVAPFADVDAADIADRPHCALDPPEHDAKLGKELVWKLAHLA